MLSHTPLGKIVLATALSAVAFFQPGLAQVPPASVLRIDTVNAVVYFEDTADVSKFTTDPGTPTPLLPGKNFNRQIGIADIQAVNGQPVMGVHTRVGMTIGLKTAPTLGQAIADSVRNAADEISFEILKSDGTPIGTIMASGFIGGASPPGSPSKVTVSNIGGYWWHGSIPWRSCVACGRSQILRRGVSASQRSASRREGLPRISACQNGGGTQRWVIHLIPMERPEIAALPAGPAITHSSDFSLVTSSRPAMAGEILSLFATGLGPMSSGIDSGEPFPSEPPCGLSSSTRRGDVSQWKALRRFWSGWWASPAPYERILSFKRIFEVPPDKIAKGPASIQLSAAWISGTAVGIAVQ